MTAIIQPLSEISQRARALLIQELGVTDAMRFLNQFQVGHGDYTTEREHLFKGDTLKSIAAAIKAQRTSQT
jgi:hypothetical protein